MISSSSRVTGERLGVVPGAGRDHTGAALRLGEQEEPVERPPVLERAGALPQFGLEADVAARRVAQRAGRTHRFFRNELAGYAYNIGEDGLPYVYIIEGMLVEK